MPTSTVPEHLAEIARSLPSMGGVKIGRRLTAYAERCPPGAAIVELGCWLGAGTAHLALGAMKSGATIHCYDRWCLTDQEVRKARPFGVELAAGEDTLPRVQRSLEPFPVAIHYHRGEIATARWSDGPIGLYVDDASKADLWTHAMATFGPWFIEGETFLFLMDYHHDEKAGPEFAAQKEWMRDHAASFELVESRMADTSCALFRCVGAWA